MSTQRRASDVIVRLGAAAAFAGLVALVPVAGASAAPSPRTSPSEFSQPSAIVSVRSTLWVTNEGANSVTELSNTGALLRTINTAHDGIRSPQAIAANTTDVFVANKTNTITELSEANGMLVRVISAKSYHLMDPTALLVSGADLWVVNSTGNSLTEIATATGALVRTVTNQQYGPVRFDQPTALAVSGANLWVTNAAINAVTEVQTKSGSFVQTITATADGFSAPAGIASQGTHLWITESGTDSVTELSAATGALDQVITNSSLNEGYGFNEPSVVLAGAGVVYVVSPPGGSPMVTQVQTSSGNANWMMCNTNYAFNFLAPDGLAINGANLWVANGANNTLTEMNATTGVLVQDVG